MQRWRGAWRNSPFCYAASHTLPSVDARWTGTTPTSRLVAGVVLSDGWYWISYGARDDPSVLVGLVQGTGTSLRFLRFLEHQEFQSGRRRNSLSDDEWHLCAGKELSCGMPVTMVPRRSLKWPFTIQHHNGCTVRRSTRQGRPVLSLWLRSDKSHQSNDLSGFILYESMISLHHASSNGSTRSRRQDLSNRSVLKESLISESG